MQSVKNNFEKLNDSNMNGMWAILFLLFPPLPAPSCSFLLSPHSSLLPPASFLMLPSFLPPCSPSFLHLPSSSFLFPPLLSLLSPPSHHASLLPPSCPPPASSLHLEVMQLFKSNFCLHSCISLALVLLLLLLLLLPAHILFLLKSCNFSINIMFAFLHLCCCGPLAAPPHCCCSSFFSTLLLLLPLCLCCSSSSY